MVAASYFFYACWDWRFLTLIAVSTFVDFIVGQALGSAKNPKLRKQLLYISIFVNLGLLGFFKFFNFFVENFHAAFSLFGKPLEVSTLHIVLPVGISFYTFQTLSYTIDIYKRKIEPTHDPVEFAAFVSFFPQLVAGPIERAKNLLPQFQTKRTFQYSEAVDGMRQIGWGLFKKIAIADRCAPLVNEIFADPASHHGSTLFIAAFLFTIQIYADFSGYSDIAIGTAKLFGFRLMQNFNYPFFSRDFGEGWRKWHISLTTWFRDYVYIPLAKARAVTTWTKITNVFIVFVLVGFWHGANWTFLFWGFLHAIYFLPTHLSRGVRRNRRSPIPELREAPQMVFCFLLTVFSVVFFRSETLQQAFAIFSKIFSRTLFDRPDLINDQNIFYASFIIFFFIVEWKGRRGKHALEWMTNWHKSYRMLTYYSLTFFIFWFANQKQEFIYFDF
ncbi:MBOAT family O-acyltransferase [Cyclobacterium xiamenense]|uniref:MBOAT family O-acyltransferase n=1 Tax=Cyclobacterium xiamenense TaxID=1297121 RepID=UPI001FD0618B|nr:MBOAT family O-acyltransferase [Cyclobacterium xiamenense]